MRLKRALSDSRELLIKKQTMLITCHSPLLYVAPAFNAQHRNCCHAGGGRRGMTTRLFPEIR